MYKKKLFLDDTRKAIACAEYMKPRTSLAHLYSEEWDVVKDYNEFVAWITTNGLPDIVSFGDIYESQSDNREFQCAVFLMEYCLMNGKSLPPFLVHSFNPVGSKKITDLLTHFNNIQSQLS